MSKHKTGHSFKNGPRGNLLSFISGPTLFEIEGGKGPKLEVNREITLPNHGSWENPLSMEGPPGTESLALLKVGADEDPKHRGAGF